MSVRIYSSNSCFNFAISKPKNMNENSYRQVRYPINSSLYTVQSKDYKWGVVDEDDNIIVPFGKYNWIDGFQNGFAKVIGHNDNAAPFFRSYRSDGSKKVTEHGIIDENAKEILRPGKFCVWKFYDKDFDTIRLTRDGQEADIPFEFFARLSAICSGEYNPDDYELEDLEEYDEDEEDVDYTDEPECDSYMSDYGTNYGEYAGTYAQDVMGYSDDVINDAFDGEPDAYWNID